MHFDFDQISTALTLIGLVQCVLLGLILTVLVHLRNDVQKRWLIQNRGTGVSWRAIGARTAPRLQIRLTVALAHGAVLYLQAKSHGHNLNGHNLSCKQSIDANMKEAAESAAEIQSDAPIAQGSTREEDLLWHMSHGYQLETSSLWDNPILRHLKDNAEVRATANRGTIEALEKDGLISEVAKLEHTL